MSLQQSTIICGNAVFNHYFLTPYFPLTAGEDRLSHSLVRFKQRLQPDLDAWIDCATGMLGSRSFSPDTIIVRALRHEETTVRLEFPSALDLLGQSLARNLRCRYLPGLLAKCRATLPGKYLTRGQRRAQLRDVYRLGAVDYETKAAISPDVIIKEGRPILLIDDILTTGTTVRAIFSLLREKFPGSAVEAFTLTRADYRVPGPRDGGNGDSGNLTLDGLKTLIFANTV